MYCDCVNWHDFVEHTKSRKLILFGAGRLAKMFISAYHDKFEISAIVDNNPQLWGTELNDITIYHASKLKEFPPENIVVLMCGPGYEMSHELRTLNIDCFYDYAILEKSKYYDNVDLDRHYHPKYSFDYSWIRQVNHRYGHALGTIDNYMFTNSREAFEYNYQLGYRAFETDICRIADGTLLLCHDISLICRIESNIRINTINDHNVLINGHPWSITEFRKEKIYGKYTPLTTLDLILLMKKYPDVYIITQTRDSHYKDGYSCYKQLVQEAIKVDSSILDRFIIQVYDEYMLDMVMSIYPFKCAKLLQAYGMTNCQPINNNIDTCLKTGMKAVTISTPRISKEVVEYFNKYGIMVCTYGNIYTEQENKKFREMGAVLLCVDRFEENLEMIQ